MHAPPRPGAPYQPSGRLGASTFLWVPLLGVPAAAVLGAAYAYAILYIPVAGYVTFLLTGGFGFLLGLAAAAGVKRGKARSPGVAALLGAVVGLAGLWLSWAVWIFAFARRADADVPLLALLLAPGALWQLIREVNAHGAWTIKGATPTGAWLWLFWSVEALIVVGLPVAVCLAQASSPFCERCREWCVKAEGAFVGGAAAPQEIVARLRALDVAFLAEVGPAAPGAPLRVRYDLRRCRCGATSTISATALTTAGAGKKAKESSKALVADLLLSPDADAAVRGLARAR
jgi:hypothetical protein